MILYWIYDETCKSLDDGYIGVTINLVKRFNAHKRNHEKIHNDCKIQIIFEGTDEECFMFEKSFRPEKCIGWNNAVGGRNGWKLGFKHSTKTKNLMKNKWTEDRRKKASIFRKKQNKLMLGQKRPKQSKAMLGDKNPMYGTIRPDYVKEAIRNAHIGKIPPNKRNNFCKICGKRVSISIEKKYHGLGKKNCKMED